MGKNLLDTFFLKGFISGHYPLKWINIQTVLVWGKKKNFCLLENNTIIFAPVLYSLAYQERLRDMAL